MNNEIGQNFVWQGFSRKNGLKGIRNKVLVLYTVECAAFVAKEIVRLSAHKDVEVVGFSGCTDNEYAVRMLAALVRHPNVGAVLVVGLGCEYIQADRLAAIAKEEEKVAHWLLIQEQGGTKSTIEKGNNLVKNMLEELKSTPLVDMHLCDLVVGAECGGSDYTSGLAGNVVVGHFFDLLVTAGGTAIFEEIVEAIGLGDVLENRGANKQAKKEIRHTYHKALAYCKSVKQYSISPGNFVGGLSTIEEKSMGAIIKSGSQPINGVLKVSQNPPKQGLWLLDSTPDPYWMEFGITNPNDNEGLMALLTCGCQLLLFVTGRGNVVGSAIAPVLKITGNSTTFRQMKDDMDFSAGDVLTGTSTFQEITAQLLAQVLAVAKGSLTKAEILGHKEYYIPYKYQSKHCTLNN